MPRRLARRWDRIHTTQLVEHQIGEEAIITVLHRGVWTAWQYIRMGYIVYVLPSYPAFHDVGCWPDSLKPQPIRYGLARGNQVQRLSRRQ